MNSNWKMLDPSIMGDEANMHALFRDLRENEPVSYVDHPEFEPFWAVTKHEDIKNISQNNAEFLNNPRTVLIQREFEQALLAQFGTRNGLETLIHMDNPKHKKLRNVTREWFKPGPIDTPLLDKAQPERVDELMKKVYTRRKGRPDEVAEAIRWLALDAPEIINGAVIDVTDGSFLR